MNVFKFIRWRNNEKEWNKVSQTTVSHNNNMILEYCKDYYTQYTVRMNIIMYDWDNIEYYWENNNY